MDSYMKVIANYNDIENGMIKRVTYFVSNESGLIQESTFEILDCGKNAVLISNKLHTENEQVITESFPFYYGI